MMIREATIDDLPTLLRLRARLWPHCAGEENEKEMIQILRSPRHGAMLAFREDDGTPCGYLELSMRDYVDGCKSSPVGYIEGIYIEVADRGRGIGRKMIEDGLLWLASRGCSEVGSDALIENQGSIDFHKKLGFEEVERQVVFIRTIKPETSG